MEKFLALISSIDKTTSTNEKVDAISDFFVKSSPKDAVWGLFFLSGNRFKRLLSSQKLRQWCQEEVSIPDWLFEESYARVGDTAEVIALLFPGNLQNVAMRPLNQWTLSQWIEEFILPLGSQSEELQRKAIVESWKIETTFERLIMNKILTGSFRIGVSSLLTIKGLSKAFSIPPTTLSIKLAGDWQPTESFFNYLISEATPANAGENERFLQPYPFFLSSPIEEELSTLGDPHDWLAEWKWDGIRAQIVNHRGQQAIWSRGNELISASFPELAKGISPQPTFILDGEILAYENERPLPFADLQKRLSRKNVTTAIQNKYPVVYMIYDLLEWEGEDVRSLSFIERRKKIQEHMNCLAHPLWKISPLFPFDSWEDVVKLRENAFQNMTEGLMLKRKNSEYGVGRRRGGWWKFKVESMTIDAVLIYAQPGSGYRSGLYTDYTFAVWEKGELVPIAKAYSGLTQEEIKEVDKWIRKETVEKFGPVRRVKPELVFEIAFENIQESKRHKAGLALRFPRIKRWRKDKKVEMADSLDTLRSMLQNRLLP